MDDTTQPQMVSKLYYYAMSSNITLPEVLLAKLTYNQVERKPSLKFINIIKF